MPIAFSNIPQDWRVPLYWAEIDPSMAGLGAPNRPALLCGTMLSTGDATPDVATPIATQAQADARFGIGSELAKMFKAFFANNWANQVLGVGVAEPTGTGAAAATGVVVVNAAPTAGGTIHLYIGAEHVPINIGSGDTEEEIADAMADAINEREWLPVTASTSAVVPPLNLASPVLSGAPEVDGTVTTTNGTWTNTPTSFAITWQKDGTDIGGETANTYTPVIGDIGSVLTATAIASNATGPSAPAVSLPSDPVAAAPLLVPVNLTVPVLTESLVAAQTPFGRGRRGRTRAAAPTNVTLTCKWIGENGNDIRISLNYFGTVGGQILPQGLDIDLPATGFLTGGVGVPDFSNTISNLGEQAFKYVAMPYTDAVSLGVWETEYGFGDDGRWGWMRQLYGHIFSARRGGYTDLIAFGSTRNGPVTTIEGFEVTSPSPVYEWAAAYCAKAQRSLSNDPAMPLQTLTLQGILMAPPSERFILSEVNTFAHYGLATQIASADNVTPMIARESTTYQLNLFGFADDAYELVTTTATLDALLTGQRQVITTKYARCKLANDGTRFGPGQRVATPGIIKAELVSNYRADMFIGLVEDIRNFKNNLIVERDVNNPNRLNVLYPPDLINQLRIFAVVAQFRLQYDRGLDVQLAA
jgi:phage tail sheath gpL-like